MTATRDLISVLLPVHNGQRYLGEAVDSIRQQTIENWELVVVDDASTDGSHEILRRYAQVDSRIKIVPLRHRAGVTAALNHGWRACHGEFVARMDADDICLPERFQVQQTFLRAHSQVVAVGCWVLRIDMDGDPIGLARWPQHHQEIDRGLMRGAGGLPHPAAMIRNTELQRIGGYREEFRLAQDKDLWLRLAEVGELANVPQVLLKYREHAQSMGASQQQDQRAHAIRAVDDARRRRNLPGVVLHEDSRAESTTAFRQREAWVKAALRHGHRHTACKHLQQWAEIHGRSARWWWWRMRSLLPRI